MTGSVFFCRRCTPFINKIIKKLHCDRRRAFHGVTSQVPQPTCFWKWVGRTNPQKSGILTLEVSFSAKKNSTVKSSTELGRVIQYLQILPSGNIFKNFTWPRRPFDSHPPVWPPAPPISPSHFFNCISDRAANHISPARFPTYFQQASMHLL